MAMATPLTVMAMAPATAIQLMATARPAIATRLTAMAPATATRLTGMAMEQVTVTRLMVMVTASSAAGSMLPLGAIGCFVAIGCRAVLARAILNVGRGGSRRCLSFERARVTAARHDAMWKANSS